MVSLNRISDWWGLRDIVKIIFRGVVRPLHDQLVVSICSQSSVCSLVISRSSLLYTGGAPLVGPRELELDGAEVEGHVAGGGERWRTVHCPTRSAGFHRIPPESAGIHKTCHPDFFSVTQAKLASPVQCSPTESATFWRNPRIRTGLFH